MTSPRTKILDPRHLAIHDAFIKRSRRNRPRWREALSVGVIITSGGARQDCSLLLTPHCLLLKSHDARTRRIARGLCDRFMLRPAGCVSASPASRGALRLRRRRLGRPGVIPLDDGERSLGDARIVPLRLKDVAPILGPWQPQRLRLHKGKATLDQLPPPLNRFVAVC